MNSESIYAILASKPHNPHYLKRYLKFIEWCKQNPSNDDYTEDHHICPKAVDLFPEYISFRDNPWNCVSLDTKQHIIAHVMLWKAYPNTNMSMALDCILGNFNSETNSRLINRKIPEAIRIRYLSKARKDAALKRCDYVRGKSTYKDSNGNKYFIPTNDPLIAELGLVGNNLGLVHTEESKQRMSDTKFPNRKVQLYFLDKVLSVPLFSEDYDIYINQGWSLEKLESDYKYCKEQGNQKNSEFWTNRARYATPDGTYHGSYLKDDPVIADLNLVPYRTEAQVEQNASRVVLATEAKLGTQIYNNGVEEKFLRGPIDSTWVVGRLERSDEWESKRKAAANAKVVGAKTYNNGVKNLFIQSGEPIPEGFVLGMKPQKVREFSFTNGVETIRCSLDKAPEGYTLTRYFKKL
jgi:hypothetical protein